MRASMVEVTVGISGEKQLGGLVKFMGWLSWDEWGEEKGEGGVPRAFEEIMRPILLGAFPELGVVTKTVFSEPFGKGAWNLGSGRGYLGSWDLSWTSVWDIPDWDGSPQSEGFTLNAISLVTKGWLGREWPSLANRAVAAVRVMQRMISQGPGAFVPPVMVPELMAEYARIEKEARDER